MLTALMVKPGEQPHIVSLVPDIDYLNAAVSIGGTLMCNAEIMLIEKGIVAILACEGIMVGLRGNRKIGKRIIAGTFYVLGIDKGELRSLSRDEITRFSLRFQKIREYTDDEVIDSLFD